VLYPELLKRYREAGDRVEGIRDRVERTYLTLAVLVPAMCGLAYLLSRDLMGGVLPKFMPGLDAVRIVCFGVGGLAFVGLSAIVLMTLRRQAYLVPASILGAALGAVLDLIAVQLRTGITGVAWATLFAYVINGMVMLWLATMSLHGTWRRCPAMVARALGALALSFAIAWGLDRVLPFADAPHWGRRLLHMLLAVATFLPLYALAGHPLGRGTGLRQMLAEFAPAWSRRAGPPDS
jgi:O-antigen/teichoic acid export membrane protein